MTKKILFFRYSFLIIVCIGIISGLVWGNNVVIHQKPVEKKFMVPWLGLRLFLETGDNPYGKPAAQNAQLLFYGHQAITNEDPLQLSQPFAREILLFPLTLINEYTSARNVWMLILELALIASAILSLLLFDWKLRIWLIAFYILVFILGVDAIKPLLDNDGIILQSLFFIGGLYFLRIGKDEIAGGMISLTFLTPSATGLFGLFSLTWIIINRRWRILWGILMTLGFLFIVSFALLPGWLVPFIQSFKTQIPFIGYNSTYHILSKFWPAIGNKIAIALSLGIFILMIFEFRAKEKHSFRWFIWIAMFSLASSFLLGIPTIQANSIFLFFPIAYIIKIISDRLTPGKRMFFIGILLGVLFVGGWVVEFKFKDLIPGLMNILLPSIMIVIGLYWIRWWSIKPYQTRMHLIDSE